MDNNKLVGGLEEFLNEEDFVLGYRDIRTDPPIISLYSKPPITSLYSKPPVDR